MTTDVPLSIDVVCNCLSLLSPVAFYHHTRCTQIKVQARDKLAEGEELFSPFEQVKLTRTQNNIRTAFYCWSLSVGRMARLFADRVLFALTVRS